MNLKLLQIFLLRFHEKFARVFRLRRNSSKIKRVYAESTTRQVRELDTVTYSSLRTLSGQNSKSSGFRNLRKST